MRTHPTRSPPPTLLSMDYGNLPGALSQLFCEIRRVDNSEFRADSIKVYFSAIARAIKETDPNMNIHGDPLFYRVKKTVDGLVRTLRRRENPSPKQAEEISEENELDQETRDFLAMKRHSVC